MNDAGSVIIVHAGQGLTAWAVQKHPTSLQEMWGIRAAWHETFQWQAGGWNATPGDCDGKIIPVLSTGRSHGVLHHADEKMSLEEDVKRWKSQRAELINLDRTLSLSQKWLLQHRLTFSAGFAGVPSQGSVKEPWSLVAHVMTVLGALDWLWSGNSHQQT